MKKWKFYTTNEIKPSGWLRRQLDIQARGLSGNLDKVWKDIGDSRWIGGSAEGWERVPYWLDGFIPLAYLLDDEELKERAKKYIDAIIGFQCEDGWICPCGEDERATYDTWAVILISKTLTVYYECSKDETIPGVIYRAMKNFYELLNEGTIKLFDWGEFRWFEAFIALDLLMERYNEHWIIELARLLRRQGADYDSFYELWKKQQEGWRFDTHIVNIGMMFKSEAVSCELLGEEYTDLAERRYELLKKYNGTPVEMFTGDECLGGLDPTRGTELCSVVELMYSYEQLFAYTGDPKWLERLEVVAFNALPATIDDDMWTHQYDQMSNQIACIRFPDKRSVFGTNGDEAHLFGLEPNFGCCTANFNQGWPKLALSTFMYSEGKIINALPIPSRLDCEDAAIGLETEYPFENSFTYHIEAKRDFEFTVRVPSFAEEVKLDGISHSGDVVIELKAGESRRISLSFDTAPYFEDRPGDLKTVKCGSLVFALPIRFRRSIQEYECDGDPRKFPYCDYELIPESEWSYAYVSDELKAVRYKPDGIPFSSQNPPVIIETKVVPIAWGYNENFDTVCARLPLSRVPRGEEQGIKLYPYGCAKLRMTEIPKIK